MRSLYVTRTNNILLTVVARFYGLGSFNDRLLLRGARDSRVCRLIPTHFRFGHFVDPARPRPRSAARWRSRDLDAFDFFRAVL